MRATWIQTLLLLGAAAAAAGAFALAAGPRGAPEAHSTPLRMPAATGRSVVDARPAPGRPESSPLPVVRAPATPVETPKPRPAKPRVRPRAGVRVVTVPGVVLTRAEPVLKPRVQLVRAKPKKPVTVTRELAGLPQPEPMHDSRPRPHE
jgi:hypothetical protein